jgi:hypothetical protein
MFRVLNRLRTLLIATICLALPWSAGAAVLDGLGCPYQGASVSATGEQAMAPMPNMDDMNNMSGSGAHHGDRHCNGDDDGAAKCSCCHHCAGVGSALIAINAASIIWNDSTRVPLRAMTKAVPRGRLLTEVFRPPNAAPELGAA